MKLLSRYIAGIYLKYWSLCLMALVLLVIISNLFGNLDSIVTSPDGLFHFLDDTLRSLPGIFDLLLPMTALLATLFTFNSLGRSSELVAMQSVGVGLLGQLRPIGLVLVFISALVYGNQNYLFRMLQHADPAAATSADAHQWTVLRDQIIYARRVDPQRGRVTDVEIFTLASRPPFRLERLQRAQHVERGNDDTWRLQDVITRTLGLHGWTLNRAPTLERPRKDFPDLFQQDVLDAHHMPFFELSSRIRQLQSQGRRVELYELEWYQKTAALFAPFALVWFGTPLAQGHFRRGRASGEIMVGILGGLLFLIATEIVFTLGKGGYLSPLLGAWAVNGAYVVLGCALMWRVR
ncbi:MAG TPA: LptF/LptG family permease [bacterium]|nr:LptF/LptG family permease [bacterium]